MITQEENPLMITSSLTYNMDDYQVSKQNTIGRLEKLPEHSSYSHTPSLFGYPEFKRKKNLPDFYLDSEKGMHLVGFYLDDGKQFVLKAGSIISEFLYPSGPKSRDLSDVEQHPSGHYITTKDKLFPSLSSATSYGLGYSESSTKRWKDSTGKVSMRKYIETTGDYFIKRTSIKNRNGKQAENTFID